MSGNTFEQWWNKQGRLFMAGSDVGVQRAVMGVAERAFYAGQTASPEPTPHHSNCYHPSHYQCGTYCTSYKNPADSESASPVAQQEAATLTDEQSLKAVDAQSDALKKAQAPQYGTRDEHILYCALGLRAAAPYLQYSREPAAPASPDGIEILCEHQQREGEECLICNPPGAPEAKGEPAAQPVVAGGAELCRTCGANCIIWFTDNVLWNKYGKFGILCVSCFVKKAEEMGFECTGWKLSPEGWTERLFPTTHDGDRKEP